MDDADNPSPGDYSVCLDCAVLLRYDDQLILQKITKEDLDRLKAEDLAAYRKLLVTQLIVKKTKPLQERYLASRN